jgi:hypothetical protein
MSSVPHAAAPAAPPKSPIAGKWLIAIPTIALHHLFY